MYSKKQVEKARDNMRRGAASLPDEIAVETPEIFASWEAGARYVLNDRFQYDGALWRCEQPELTASEIYPPGGAGTESLYSRVAKPGDGTHDNPIKYNNNMRLELGKYYTQYDVLYLCINDSINPVYADLQYLVPLYVQVAE